MLAGTGPSPPESLPGSTCPADSIGETMMFTAIRRAGAALRRPALAAVAALSVWSLSPARAQSPPDLGAPGAAIDDLVAANRILYRQGVVDGFGHISIRHPERKDRFL